MKPLRLIISGGGTGGHVYPAIAIADAIKAISQDADILFVGAMGKMEMEKVPLAGYPIEGLWISGLQRKLSPQLFLFPVKLASSLFRAASIIRRFRPDAVVGVGGYASGAIMRVATRYKIPTLIQEQNSYAGLTNKLVANQVDAICVAYPDMGQYFPASKIHMTGNPVRQDIWGNQIDKATARQALGLAADKPTILVLGGSLGSKTLNDSMEAGWEKLHQAGIQIIWQTGKFYFEGISSRIGQSLPSTVKMTPVISNMPTVYAAADMAISRAGALSVSELSLTGMPSILVPSPNVAEDHQTKNAQALSTKGAAILITDAKARQQLVEEAISLIKDHTRQETMRQAILKLAKPYAARDIADLVLKIATSKTQAR